MNWMRALRWLLIVDILIQPVICCWLVMIALRIRRDQEHIRQFVQVWGDRMSTVTVLPDPVVASAIGDLHQTIKEHDQWERERLAELQSAREQGKADGVKAERQRVEGEP